jgi:hypothetical protein
MRMPWGLRMIRKQNRCAIALAASILSLGTQIAAARDPPLLSLSMEHFRDTASITEDPAAASVAISTEPGFVEHRGPLRTVWSDEYLRGLIDNKSDRKSFEVDAVFTYSGARRSYRSAEYRTASGLKEAMTTLVNVETINCAVECMYTEHLVFPVEEQALRAIASSYAPGKPVLWTFKLIAKGGPGYQGAISTAEIAGLLAKMDGYTHAPPVVAMAAPAPRPLDFGISGIAVAASAEMPNRAGVLVAGVTPGSIAQKAGIIVGDIIYGLDARPIKTLPDLQAAMTASPATAPAVIKVFRGTDELSLALGF